ncbi:MAG: hypothetical protein KAU95_01645 [Candidatus Aenigmarchaeota archaeon]|nr:hypothetical protein [Candidatus Aenigmarchaeota archaeon]
MKANSRKPRKFSTENAEYTLYPGVHGETTKIKMEDMKDYDAIVLETGFNDYENYDMINLLSTADYSEVIGKNLLLDEPKPIFYVDIPPKKWLGKKGSGYNINKIVHALSFTIPFGLGITNLPLGIPLMMPAISLYSCFLKENTDKLDKVINYLGVSYFYTQSGFRSAISAKKIEEFVVPEIEKRKDDEKPNIFIEYGALHGDLEPYLKHKKLRDLAVGFHEKKKISLLDMEYVNKVSELKLKEYETYSADKIIWRKDDFFDDLGDWEKIIYEI